MEKLPTSKLEHHSRRWGGRDRGSENLGLYSCWVSFHPFTTLSAPNGKMKKDHTSQWVHLSGEIRLLPHGYSVCHHKLIIWKEWELFPCSPSSSEKPGPKRQAGLLWVRWQTGCHGPTQNLMLVPHTTLPHCTNAPSTGKNILVWISRRSPFRVSQCQELTTSPSKPVLKGCVFSALLKDLLASTTSL